MEKFGHHYVIYSDDKYPRRINLILKERKSSQPPKKPSVSSSAINVAHVGRIPREVRRSFSVPPRKTARCLAPFHASKDISLTRTTEKKSIMLVTLLRASQARQPGRSDKRKAWNGCTVKRDWCFPSNL